MNRKQASSPSPTSPARVGAHPRGAHPPHPERFWVSNGIDRYRAPRRHSALYLVLALLGVAVLLIEIVTLIGGMR